MDKPISEYTYEEIQAITDGRLLQKLIDDSFREEEEIDDCVRDAEKEVRKAEWQVGQLRRQSDRLCHAGYSMEVRCKALGFDPSEGHYAWPVNRGLDGPLFLCPDVHAMKQHMNTIINKILNALTFGMLNLS